MSFFGIKRERIKVEETGYELAKAEYKRFLQERNSLLDQIDGLIIEFIQRAKSQYGDRHTYLFKQLRHVTSVMLTATDSKNNTHTVVYPVIFRFPKEEGIRDIDIYNQEEKLLGFNYDEEELFIRMFFQERLYAVDNKGYLFEIDFQNKRIKMISVETNEDANLELVAGITRTKYAVRQENHLDESHACTLRGFDVSIKFCEDRENINQNYAISDEGQRTEYATENLQYLENLIKSLKQTLELGKV